MEEARRKFIFFYFLIRVTSRSFSRDKTLYLVAGTKQNLDIRTCVNFFFALMVCESSGVSRSADSTRRIGNAIPGTGGSTNGTDGKSVQYRQQISLYFSRSAKNNKTISQNE